MTRIFKEKSFWIFDSLDSPLVKFDYVFLRLRLKLKLPILDFIFPLFANIDKNYFLSTLLYLFIIFLFYLNFNYSTFFFLLLSVFLSDQICRIFFKKQIRRYRPKTWFLWGEEKKEKKTALAIFNRYSGYSEKSLSSMCSSHSSNYLVLTLALYHIFPEVTRLIFLLPLLVGIGRWYIGAHWLSDILVAYVVAFFAFKISLYFVGI